MKKIAMTVVCAWLGAMLLYAQSRPTAPTAAACANLASLGLSGATITSAKLVPPGHFTPPGGEAAPRTLTCRHSAASP